MGGKKPHAEDSEAYILLEVIEYADDSKSYHTEHQLNA